MATPQAQFAAAFAASQDARGSAQQIMEANAWLERFQSTTDAWQVADQLLQHGAQAGEGAGALVFAAQTMRSKIQYDWAELPAESHASLRSSLLAHVVRYGVGPQPVLTQLCLAIATLALHMESWGGVVGDLIGAMTTPPESAATKLPCLLGLLTVLPEEAENFKVRAPLPPLLSARAVAVPTRAVHVAQVGVLPRRREQFRELLRESGPAVLQLLSQA